MFQHLSEATSQKTRQKIAYIIQNGSPDKLFIHNYIRSLNKEDIVKAAEKQWGVNKYRCSRLFSMQGVEYHEEDLIYIRDSEKIYISKGQQFDSNLNFGEYEILQTLGEGGFGKVSLGRNIITQDLVAIKVLKVDKINGASDIDMIFREIQNLKALSHPNIVRILNCYTLENMQVVVIMEYLQGGQLQQLLEKRGKFTQKQGKTFFKQLISAVSYCHRNNIVHRDLKLQNILISQKNSSHIKVTDFGISGLADQFNPDVDTGTLRFMSPEVLTGKQKANTAAVDIWACGVILYYMLYGVHPFLGTKTSQITNNISKGKFNFPKKPYISQQCKQLINKMLDINPKTRFKISEVEDDEWLSFDFKIPNLTQQTLQITDNLKKNQRKSIPMPKLLSVILPKRLQKQKLQLIEQLEGYRIEKRKQLKSQGKFQYNSQNLPIIYPNIKISPHKKAVDSKQKRKTLENVWK